MVGLSLMGGLSAYHTPILFACGGRKHMEAGLRLVGIRSSNWLVSRMARVRNQREPLGSSSIQIPLTGSSGATLDDWTHAETLTSQETCLWHFMPISMTGRCRYVDISGDGLSEMMTPKTMMMIMMSRSPVPNPSHVMNVTPHLRDEITVLIHSKTLSVFYGMLGAVTDDIRVWTDISRAKWHGSVGKLPYFS